MDNLLLLSIVATTAEPPKKRIRKPNPRCIKAGHSSWKKQSIQRHTCSTCFKERANELVSNPNLTRWDVACMLVREFRNYFCCCCILEAVPRNDFTKICHSKLCRRGHGAICKQRKCIAHKVRLTVCRDCPDPRAGTSFHICGARVMMKCDCDSALGLHPQSPAVVELKETFAVAMLKRASEMETTACAC